MASNLPLSEYETVRNSCLDEAEEIANAAVLPDLEKVSRPGRESLPAWSYLAGVRWNKAYFKAVNEIYAVKKAAGVTAEDIHVVNNKKLAERNAKMAAMRAEGISYVAIGKKFSVSPGWVREIVYMKAK